MGKAPLAILIIVLVAFVPGCTKQDTDCLGRIGRKVVDRAHGVTDTVREKIDWKGLRSGGGSTLQDKVAGRLRWDKNLEGVPIEVVVTDKNVELKGTVKNQDMRFRAVELAETTAGVDRVTDSLQILDP
jgi:osmotically-inducible protein OsmY